MPVQVPEGALALAIFFVMCAGFSALLWPYLVTRQPEQRMEEDAGLRGAKITEAELMKKEDDVGEFGVLAHGDIQIRAILAPGLGQTQAIAERRPSWQNSFRKAGPLFQTYHPPAPAISDASQGARSVSRKRSITPLQQEANAWTMPPNSADVEAQLQLDEKVRSARLKPEERFDEGRYAVSATTLFPQGANARLVRRHSMTTVYSAERFKEGATARIGKWHPESMGQLGDEEPYAQPANSPAASVVGNSIWSTSPQEAVATNPRPNWQTQVSFGRFGPMIQTSHLK